MPRETPAERAFGRDRDHADDQPFEGGGGGGGGRSLGGDGGGSGEYGERGARRERGRGYSEDNDGGRYRGRGYGDDDEEVRVGTTHVSGGARGGGAVSLLHPLNC